MQKPIHIPICRALGTLLLALGTIQFSTISQSQVVEYLLAGGSDVTDNPLSNARELALDKYGDVYVSDIGRNAIFRASASAGVTKYFDGQTYVQPGSSQIGEAIALDDFGNFFLTISYEYKEGYFRSGVLRISSSGEQKLIIDSGGDGRNALGGAQVIEPDEFGNVYIGGYSLSDHTVFKIFPDGSIRLLINWSGDGKGNILDIVDAIASDSRGNVYVAGCRSNNVFRVNPDYSVELLIDQSGDGLGNELLCPSDIHVGDEGNVYVTGYNSHNAFQIAPGGLITELIDMTTDGTGEGYISGVSGAPHWAANPTALLRPDSISTDTLGNVFVVGRFSGNIFKIAANGQISLQLAVERQAMSEGVHFGSPPIATLQNTKFDELGNAYSLIPEYRELFKLVIDDSAAERAIEDQGNIFIPSLLVDNIQYRVVLTRTDSGDDEYLVTSADEVIYKRDGNTANYSNGRIVISELFSGGVSAPANFTLVKLIPLTFRRENN